MSDSSISLTPNGSGVSNSKGSSQASQSAAGESKQAAAGSAEGNEQSGQSGSGEVSRAKLEESTELLNKSAEILQRDIRFNVVPSEDVIQAEIINRQTDEVIKKIPPDEIIEMRKKIDAFIGLFVDEQR